MMINFRFELINRIHLVVRISFRDAILLKVVFILKTTGCNVRRTIRCMLLVERLVLLDSNREVAPRKSVLC